MSGEDLIFRPVGFLFLHLRNFEIFGVLWFFFLIFLPSLVFMIVPLVGLVVVVLEIFYLYVFLIRRGAVRAGRIRKSSYVLNSKGVFVKRSQEVFKIFDIKDIEEACPRIELGLFSYDIYFDSGWVREFIKYKNNDTSRDYGIFSIPKSVRPDEILGALGVDKTKKKVRIL